MQELRIHLKYIEVQKTLPSYIFCNFFRFKHAPLIDVIQNISNKCIKSDHPQSFEKLQQGYGFILYSTVLKDLDVHGKVLKIVGIHDRGYVLIGKVFRYLCIKIQLELVIIRKIIKRHLWEYCIGILTLN